MFDEDGYNNSSDENGEYGSIDMQEGCDIPHQNHSHLDYSEEIAQNFVARFFLDLKEKFKLTQVSPQGVIQVVIALNQHIA